jgi:hypothetical protein
MMNWKGYGRKMQGPLWSIILAVTWRDKKADKIY